MKRAARPSLRQNSRRPVAGHLASEFAARQAIPLLTLGVLGVAFVLAISSPSRAASIIPLLLIAAALLSGTAAISFNARAAAGRRAAQEAERALRQIGEAASGSEWSEIFGRLAESLAKTLGCRWATVGRLSADGRSVAMLALWDRDHLAAPTEHVLGGTLWEEIVRGALRHCPKGVGERYAANDAVRRMGVVGFIGHPLRDASGRVMGLLCALHDAPLPVSPAGIALFKVAVRRAEAELARLLAFEQLAESDSRHRLLLDNLVDGVVTIDGEGMIVDVNPSAERLFGWAHGEIAGQSIVTLMPHQYRERHRIGFAHYMATGQGHVIGKGTIELAGLRRDGSVFPMELAVSRFETAGGVHFIGTFRDISERKLAEEALRSSRRFFEDSLDSLSACIAILDENGAILHVNRAWRYFAEANGFADSSSGVGKGYLDVSEAAAGLGQEHVAEMAKGIRSVMADASEEFTLEYKIPGAALPRWFTASVTRFASPGPIRIMVSHEDVTTRKRSEEAIARARDAALAAARTKSEFLANMSHEIRTPMNGILGFFDLLFDSGLTDEQRDYLEAMRVSSESLLTVINDVLDFSKVDAGKIDLEVIEFDLNELIASVGLLMAPRAMEKNLTLTCLVDPEGAWHFFGDPTRLRQVLLNLVGNAVKFTEKGEVALIARVEERTSGLYILRLVIRDTGIGIPIDRKDRLFLPFSQVDGSTTRRFGGTGLGLSISKRLVELMGGRIDVESQLGLGTTFTVTLALETAPAPDGEESPAPAEAAAPGPEAAPAPRSLRILLTEDNPVNQKVAFALLSRAGHVVEVASDGREGVAAAARGSYDLILMDIQMPVMDGFETTRRIRAQEGARKRTPIVAMTAKAMKGDREQCLEAGMDDYLTKPIQRGELLRIIEKWAPQAEGNAPRNAAGGALMTTNDPA